jgi:hypothetical protein
VSVGAGYAASARVTLDLAYSHAFIGDFGIDLQEQATPQASGG